MSTETRKQRQQAAPPWWAKLCEQPFPSDEDIQRFLKKWKFDREVRTLLQNLEPQFCSLVLKDFSPPAGCSDKQRRLNLENFIDKALKTLWDTCRKDGRKPQLAPDVSQRTEGASVVRGARKQCESSVWSSTRVKPTSSSSSWPKLEKIEHIEHASAANAGGSADLDKPHKQQFHVGDKVLAPFFGKWYEATVLSTERTDDRDSVNVLWDTEYSATAVCADELILLSQTGCCSEGSVLGAGQRVLGCFFGEWHAAKVLAPPVGDEVEVQWEAEYSKSTLQLSDVVARHD